MSNPQSHRTIYYKLRSGALISFTARYSDLIIQLVVTAILSRLLSPADFGIVAVVTVIVAFFQIFSEAGLGPAIVQEANLTEDDIATIFNLTALLGILLGSLFFFSGSIIAVFYSNAVYERIARFLAFTLFFSTLSIVPQALLRKKQRFAIHGTLTIAASAISGAFSVFVAFRGASYFALVYRSILSSALLFLFCGIATKLPIKPVFKTATIKRVASFSTYQFLFNFINYFSRNLDKLLVGRFLGAAPLGYYEKSYRLMMLPLQSFTFALSPILHPILAEIREDLPSMFQAYLRLARLLALVGFPLSVYLAFCSKELILIIFGPQWLSSVPVFQILAFSVGFQMVLSSTGSIFQAAGRTDLLFMSGFLSAIIMVGGTLLGIVTHSLVILAWALVAAFGFNFFQGHYLLLCRALKSDSTIFYKEMLAPLVAVAINGIVLLPTSLLLTNLGTSIALSFLIKTTLSFVCFSGFCFFSGDYRLLEKLIRKT